MSKENFLKDIVIDSDRQDSIEITILGSEGKEETVKIDKSSAGSTFTEYEKRSVIADKISVALNRYGYRSKKLKTSDAESEMEVIEKNGGLFFVSDINKTSGLLSVCPAVSSMMTACYSMKYDDDEVHVTHDYDDRINFSISYILHKINPSYDKNATFEENYKNYVFDASPYVQDFEFTNEKSYLDSITWVILALQTARDLAIIEDPNKRLTLRRFTPEELLDNKRITIEYNEEHQKDTIKELDDGILACVKMVTDMAIEVNDGDDVVSKGWSFTNVNDSDANNTEASLYFSYAASTVFLGLLKGFQKYITIFRKIEDKFVDFLSEDLYYNYWNDWKGVIKAKNEYLAKVKSLTPEDEGYFELTDEQENFLNSLDTIDLDSKVDMANIDFFMNRINGGHRLRNVQHKGNFSRLKRQSLDVAKDVWTTFKDVLGDHFVYPNGKVVDEKSIENSGSSNELFNGLFVCGIILNSGFDMEVEGAEHDLLIDTLQACVQKTQRYYDALERNDEAYKVNNYVLQFIEKDPGNAKLGTILRKSSIKVCSLVPMLLKMNSLVSEYVIQYPQRQMKTHLISIMKNRMVNTLNQSEDVDYVWCWESDGYESITNYYYIDALNAFYNYYDKYEKQYITFDKKVNERILNSVIFQGRIGEEIKKEKDEAKRLVEAANVNAENRIAEIEQAANARIEEIERRNKKLEEEVRSGNIGNQILSAIDLHLDSKEKWIVNTFIDKVSEGFDNETSKYLVDNFVNLISNSFISICDNNNYFDQFIRNTKELKDNVDKFGGTSKIKNKLKDVFSQNFVQILCATILNNSVAQVVEQLEDEDY